jgi:hypothetical protein
MINTGGPAFPVVGQWYGDKLGGQLTHGMTLRDWFAGMALQGLLASTKTNDALVIAKDAYIIADAMIAESNKP